MGQYVRNLVRCLPRAAPDFEFLLLTDRRLPRSIVPEGCRQVVLGLGLAANSQSVSRFSYQLHSVFWMNVLVPGVLARERVDLFHGANVVVPLVGRCRCATTIPDLVSMRVPGTFTRFYEFYRRQAVSVAARRAVRIVAISDSTRRDIIELLEVAPAKVTTIHLGVDSSFSPVEVLPELERVKQQLGLPNRFILHVGAVERQKRLEPLMVAAAEILGKGLIDGVVLAGEEGRGSEDVKRVVAELGISAQVRFLGYVAQESMPALYSLARCTVYPSWYEGFGMPVLEAMACGSPVITSNTSSLPEVAGDAGLLVPPGDSEALAGALERVLANERFRNELISKGLARAGQFSWDTCAAKHADLYREVLAARC